MVAVFALAPSASVAVDAPPALERRAIVAGADMVFVRRGPGMNFPPFARLNKDSVITIKGHQGEWVQIETASAQTGFVHSRYLTLLDQEEGALPGTPPAAASEASPSPLEEDADAENGGADGDAPWLVDTAPAPEILAVAPVDGGVSPWHPPHRTSMAAERAAIAEEVRALAAAVASLERRIVDNEPIDDGFGRARQESDSGSVLGGAVLLGLLCTALGWFLGSRYSRAQERGRQARIRF